MASDKAYETITADDVAQLAGVSRWTVHRAFKKDASISAKSRGKVMAAAETLGYVPDLLAVSLASDRSGLVAILVDDFANPQQTTNIALLTKTLRRAGWHTLLVHTLDEVDASAGLLHASQHRVDAAILIGGRFNDEELAAALGAQRLRRLIVYGRVSLNPKTVSICCDDTDAMTEVAEYVLSRGYRKPLFVAGPPTKSAHILRKDVFLQRWAEATGTTPEVIVAGSYDPDHANGVVTAHFDALERAAYPDVVVCETDAIAMGAMDALRYGFGLRVPDDIAVTGFDDVPYAGNRNYDLTTYQQPNAVLADAVVEVLKGAANTAQFSKLSGKLVVRSSA
ncbi:substrate-binding domain-containing protein [uncultured Tateyamaria sp.]|uniref:LacI family DNA-binding transcriptional regulator n=1 Tax=Tateyamaria sp. 1078 TaxID=3417464 RepID=UPI002617CF4F|nr:substrate-binding domain-containing protein [uncultured Tateyamaria sp.]